MYEEKTMRLDKIRRIARRLSIDPNEKSKTELIKEVQRREGNFDCFKTTSGFCDQIGCCFRDDCLSKRKR